LTAKKLRGENMVHCRCEVDAAIDRLGGDLELYKDLVDRFLEDTAGTRRHLEMARERREAGALQQSAHSLKGLAASVGAVALAGILGELEGIGRSGELDNLPSAWERFQNEWERTAQELAPYHRARQLGGATTHSVGTKSAIN
jgi:HPt (histidine-containing phosphotransfer) domain-containing protein